MKSLTINYDSNKKTFDAKNAVMTVDTRDVDGKGKARLLFTDVFQYGTNKTDASAAGTDTESFILRTVDDGEGIDSSPDVEELDVEFVEAEVTDDSEVFYSGSITGDIIAVVYTKAESDPFDNDVAIGATTLDGDNMALLVSDTNVTASKMWFMERPVPVVSDIVTFTILNGYSSAPNKHGHFAIIYRSRKKSL